MADKKEPLLIKESALFASKKSTDEVLEFMTAYAGKENAWFCAMTMALTINALVRVIDEECDGTAVIERARPLLEERA
tara:strand:- start:301 stop:534 length:234 start_codon:yes stop_codon:yes gene_type:complete